MIHVCLTMLHLSFLCYNLYSVRNTYGSKHLYINRLKDTRNDTCQSETRCERDKKNRGYVKRSCIFACKFNNHLFICLTMI